MHHLLGTACQQTSLRGPASRRLLVTELSRAGNKQRQTPGRRCAGTLPCLVFIPPNFPQVQQVSFVKHGPCGTFNGALGSLWLSSSGLGLFCYWRCFLFWLPVLSRCPWWPGRCSGVFSGCLILALLSLSFVTACSVLTCTWVLVAVAQCSPGSRCRCGNEVCPFLPLCIMYTLSPSLPPLSKTAPHCHNHC